MIPLVLATILSLAVAHSVEAQTPPTTQYRLTRSTPPPGLSAIVQKSAMTCGLPRGVPPGTGFRVEDPLNSALDCQMLGDIGGVILAGSPISSYSIAAGSADGLWSSETPATNVIPPVPPGLPRVRPGSSAFVSAEGVVGARFPFAGMDVAPILLSAYGITIHIGAPTLTVPGYDVQQGDRFAFAFWR